MFLLLNYVKASEVNFSHVMITALSVTNIDVMVQCKPRK